MEFIDFLDRKEIEILRIVDKAGYKIEENTALCLKSKNYVGFLIKKKKKIIICTDNAKNRENYRINDIRREFTFERTALHIKKAIRHEAVHVAQECNKGKLLDIKKNLSMNTVKEKALKGSTKISNEEEKERQAYILEDMPKLVEKHLIKYCL
tara:strand:+ start:71 stop:529 length:459 start_codon:yes stop_codon:yes gene_type:complete